MMRLNDIFLTFGKTIYLFMENPQQPQEGISFWQKAKIVFATILAIFIIILIVLNWNDISIRLVFKTIATPLPVIIVISLFTGYIWGTISAYRSQKRRENKNRSVQQKTTE